MYVSTSTHSVGGASCWNRVSESGMSTFVNRNKFKHGRLSAGPLPELMEKDLTQSKRLSQHFTTEKHLSTSSHSNLKKVENICALLKHEHHQLRKVKF
uniref:Uncharacterized protein n=1 Tax=Romanomermis culicivorax TaxID=13658 RepID=A0A915IZS7_ROMCU